jgi:hypothetical protein
MTVGLIVEKCHFPISPFHNRYRKLRKVRLADDPREVLAQYSRNEINWFSRGAY